MKIWKIFARLPSNTNNSEDYAAACYKGGFIAVGWTGIGDLNKFTHEDQFMNKCAKWFRGGGNRSIAQQKGVLWRFYFEVEKGDIVICPDREYNLFYVGTVLSSKVVHIPKPHDECPFGHRRNVRWEKFTLMSVELPDRFGGRLPVTRLKKDADRVLKIIQKHRLKDGLKVVQPAFPSTSFNPEFPGVRDGYEPSGIVKSRVNHGLIVNTLSESLKARKIGGIGNDQNRDLFIVENGKRMLALFEVKTDLSTSNVYEGIGQLMFHSASLKPTPKRILVIPEVPKTKTKRVLEELGIQVLRYELRNGTAIFENLDDVL